jgi:hypothetical protein
MNAHLPCSPCHGLVGSNAVLNRTLFDGMVASSNLKRQLWLQAVVEWCAIVCGGLSLACRVSPAGGGPAMPKGLVLSLGARMSPHCLNHSQPVRTVMVLTGSGHPRRVQSNEDN